MQQSDSTEIIYFVRIPERCMCINEGGMLMINDSLKRFRRIDCSFTWHFSFLSVLFAELLTRPTENKLVLLLGCRHCWYPWNCVWDVWKWRWYRFWAFRIFFKQRQFSEKRAILIIPSETFCNNKCTDKLCHHGEEKTILVLGCTTLTIGWNLQFFFLKTPSELIYQLYQQAGKYKRRSIWTWFSFHRFEQNTFSLFLSLQNILDTCGQCHVIINFRL